MNENKQTSMSEIASALSISGPTVLSIVNELKDAGLVCEVGEFGSTGGRKAKAFATIKDAAYAIGIDITRHHVGITYTDLNRKALGYERIRKVFSNTAIYFIEVAELIRSFVAKHEIDEEKIIGLGISVAGIVDRTNMCIPKSHVLDLENISFDDWTKHLPYECEVLNDAKAAAIAECHDIEKAGAIIYLALSNSVGGAVVFDMDGQSAVSGKLYAGDNWRSGEFGHVQVEADGEICYCGKKGCLDSYCSAYNLAGMSGGRLEDFFDDLASGSEKHKRAWEQYMKYLAVAVGNFRMCMDCDIILGGYVGGFMEPYMGQFRKLVAEHDIFDTEANYVKAGHYKKEAAALGAAILWMDRYIAQI
jgi:predicted NBD/HSP70 family sugar kinase